MTEELFALENLRLQKTNTTLLQIDAFSIYRNEFIICAGPNGSGKTLLIRTLIGLETASKGSVRCRGKNIRGVLSQMKDRISYVPQHPENFMLGATVKEDLLFSSSEKLLDEGESILRELGVSKMMDKPTAVLSGGELKRVAIASALLTNPEILFLDEPFTELDYDGIKEMSSLLFSLHKRGISIFLITHDLTKILAYANRLIVLNEGKIVLDIPPSSLKAENACLGIRIPNIPIEDCVWR